TGEAVGAAAAIVRVREGELVGAAASVSVRTGEPVGAASLAETNLSDSTVLAEPVLTEPQHGRAYSEPRQEVRAGVAEDGGAGASGSGAVGAWHTALPPPLSILHICSLYFSPPPLTGTVAAVFADSDFVSLRSSLEAQWEDGTLPFLQLAAELPSGLALVSRLSFSAIQR
ncbi:unnamed protein product, partial [Closterium sp. NIES-53]